MSCVSLGACNDFISHLCKIAEADGEESFSLREQLKADKFVPFCSWSGEKLQHAALTLNAVLIETPTNESLRTFLELLPRFSNLSSIRFNVVAFSPPLVDAFISGSLPNAKSLKRVHFNQCNLQDESLSKLLEAFCNFVNLERLSLCNNRFGNSSVMALVNSILVLSNNPRLTHFVLAHNNLLDEQFVVIAKQLKYQNTLRNIDISYNGLTQKVRIQL